MKNIFFASEQKRKSLLRKISVKRVFQCSFLINYNHYDRNHAGILLNAFSALILAIGLLLEPLHRFLIFNSQFGLTIQISNLVTVLSLLMVGPLRGWFVSLARIWFGWFFFGTNAGGIISPVSESIAVSFFLLVFLIGILPVLYCRFSITLRLRFWFLLFLFFILIEIIAAGLTAVFMSFNNLTWILGWYGVFMPSKIVWATFIPFNYVNYLIGPTIGLFLAFFFARMNIVKVVQKSF